MSEDEDTLLEFPCDFPIKIMGRSSSEFSAQIVGIVIRHAPDLDDSAVRCRPSRAGNFTAITVTVRATSKAQLDAIYMDLTACEEVLMAL